MFLFAISSIFLRLIYHPYRLSSPHLSLRLSEPLRRGAESSNFHVISRTIGLGPFYTFHDPYHAILNLVIYPPLPYFSFFFFLSPFDLCCDLISVLLRFSLSALTVNSDIFFFSFLFQSCARLAWQDCSSLIKLANFSFSPVRERLSFLFFARTLT